ncbi:MAG: hypothetical protein WC865_11660 [Bacteroidales bacterium]
MMKLFLEEALLRWKEQWLLPNGTIAIVRIRADIFSKLISIY